MSGCGWLANDGAVGKEFVLKRQRQHGVQDNDQDQDNLGRLSFGAGQDRVHIPDKEQARGAASHHDQAPTEPVRGQDGKNSNRDPDKEAVAVEGEHLEEVGLATKVLGCAPDAGGDEEGVGVDGAKGEGQLANIVRVWHGVNIGVDGLDN